LYQINVCYGGESSNCGVFQQLKDNISDEYYLGSFTNFSDETKSSVTATFQNGDYCASPINKYRSSEVTFIKNTNGCPNCMCAYDISVSEDVACEYKFTATLTECLLSKYVTGKEFQETVGDYLYKIKLCNVGDTNTNCGVSQGSNSLGSFTNFSDETDTSITATFQGGTYCEVVGKDRSSKVTFIMNGCDLCNCDTYTISVNEDKTCEYEITVTLTSLFL
jgi:hypothetical protein